MSIRRFLSRLAAIALLGVFLSLAILAVFQPLNAWQAQVRAEHDQETNEISALKERIRSLEADAANIPNGLPEGLLWPNEQIGTTTARIQATLSELAEQNGILPRAIAPTGTRDLGYATGATFRVEMDVPLDLLAAALNTYQKHRPPLIVERASVRRTSQGSDQQEFPTVFAQIEFLAPLQLVSEGG